MYLWASVLCMVNSSFPCFSGTEDRPLTVHTDMVLVARAMSRPDSGLEIRDRLWLKITIPRAFIGQ